MNVSLKKISVLLILLVFINGCSAISYSKDNIDRLAFNLSDHKYKKKIIIFNTFRGLHDFNSNFDLKNIFNSYVFGEYVNIAIDNEYEKLFSFRRYLKEYNDIDRFELIKHGRNLGFTAAIFQDIEDINVYRKKIGFFWFKKTESFLRIKVRILVFDFVTGSIIFNFIGKIKDLKIDELSARKLVFNKNIDYINDLLLNKFFFETAKNLKEIFSSFISNLCWNSIISLVDEEEFLISVGSNSGIKSGDMFYVLCGKQMICGYDEEIYFIPGYKIGEIEITKVNKNNAYGNFTGNEFPTIGSFIIPIL